MRLELRYHPCVEQKALADTFNQSLQALLPLDRLHARREEDEATWSALAQIGLFSIALDEDAGGSGLGAAEEALIVMELGRRLASPSVLATIGATHATEATGIRRASAAYRRDGRIVAVVDDHADAVLLRDEGQASLHAPFALRSTLDDTLWHARLGEGGSPLPAIGSFTVSALLRLRLIDAAALAGMADTALHMAVAYAGERRQFGRPIGSFQAIKHHCADMAIAARIACDQTTFAALAIDGGRDDAALQVDCAWLVAADAARRNAAANLQIHGGIGFSDEALPHLIVKRTQLLAAIAGGSEAANARVAAGSRPPTPARAQA